MTTLIIVSLASLLVGGGSVYLLERKADRQEIPVAPAPTENVATEQIEVQKNLTAPDLVAVACSTEYIKGIASEEESQTGNGDLLCREMFCRMQQRGIDSKTGGAECEKISNIANSVQILEACKNTQFTTFDDCYQVFKDRK